MKEIPTLEKTVLQIRLGKLDPQIVCRILLERIQKYDPKLRAYVRLNPEALKLAERRNYHKHRSPVLPLDHLPISVKDLIDTKGIATSYGAESVFGNHVPRADAKVVAKIKQSGGFVLGKTRTHQFALGLETPPTRNPWDAARIPGGSSGGSAAAVTAGLALCALGTDTGGSVRIPAAMCGVVGLKPSYGRISNKGVFPTAPSMDHVGPICRYASDLPMLLSAMGYKVRAKRWKRGTRIAVVRSFLEQAETGVRSAVKKCVNVLLSETLVEVEEIDELPMFNEVCKATEAIDTYEVARVHKRRFLQNPRIYGRTAHGLIKAGLEVKPRELEDALRVKRRAQREYTSLTRRFPVLIYPTIPCIAPRPEEISSYSASDFLPIVRPLEVFDLLGYPALSIPCGFVEGLPVGAHLVSYRGMDELAIALAVEYQQVTRWHTAVPDAFGEK